jgi:(S)-ureidoglycine aminohydrolase
VAAQYALITPDTHVWAALPGWHKSTAAVHISPQLGARFTQATVAIEFAGASGPAAPGVERLIYVLEGVLKLRTQAKAYTLNVGDFAYFPADKEHQFVASEASRIVLFEKPYETAGRSAIPQIDMSRPWRPQLREGGAPVPEAIVGCVGDVAGEPFMGDEDARLQVLLPTDERFDMAMNVFTYQPGAALPQVEIHVMEHGLLMLDGAGVYRLGDDWHPVQAGDVIWMASYCPQWFVAMGKTPARYLYYKDVNRDPLAIVGESE